MHTRRALLEALQTQLKTLTNYSGVWIQRAAPIRNAWPAITLFSDSESAEILTIHGSPRYQERVVTVSIIVWIRGTPDNEKAESDMDAAAADIEAALSLPTGATDFYLLSTDFNVDEEDPEIHAITLSYRLIYETIEGLIPAVPALALYDSLGSLLTDSTGDTLLSAA